MKRSSLRSVDLDFFDGRAFWLDAADYHSDSTANCIRFRLDGVLYCAEEDEDDGYRSCLGNIWVEEDPTTIQNVFKRRRVYCQRHLYYNNNTIRIYDRATEKLLIEFGTDNTDDYYPSFVGNFNAENMCQDELV